MSANNIIDRPVCDAQEQQRMKRALNHLAIEMGHETHRDKKDQKDILRVIRSLKRDYLIYNRRELLADTEISSQDQCYDAKSGFHRHDAPKIVMSGNHQLQKD